MALPWQADFYECQGAWWPWQRPDVVLPEDFVRKPVTTAGENTREEFQAWTRGFRENEPTRYNPHWGDMDMVDLWS